MKPWVIFNAAMSLDGRIGREERRMELANKLDHDRVKSLLEEVNTILLGHESISLIKKPDFSREQHKIVIVDSKAALTSSDNVFPSDHELTVVTSSHVTPLKLSKLKRRARVLVTGEYVVNLPQLLKKLYHGGARKILLEGHSNLTKRMFEEGLVNEIYLLVVPLLLGEGIDLLPQLKNLKKEKKLSLKGITQYGDQVLLHYLIK